MSTIALRPGPLSAGIDKPWIAPESLITSKLEEIGFRNIVWHAGQAGAPAARTVLNSGDWDHWISADYQGPTLSFTVPTQLKWWAPLAAVAPPVGPPVGPLETYAKKPEGQRVPPDNPSWQFPGASDIRRMGEALEPGQAIGMLCLELAAEIALFNAIRGWFKRRRG